jgi:hypothetical protein
MTLHLKKHDPSMTPKTVMMTITGTHAYSQRIVLHALHALPIHLSTKTSYSPEATILTSRTNHA